MSRYTTNHEREQEDVTGKKVDQRKIPNMNITTSAQQKERGGENLKFA